MLERHEYLSLGVSFPECQVGVASTRTAAVVCLVATITLLNVARQKHRNPALPTAFDIQQEISMNPKSFKKYAVLQPVSGHFALSTCSFCC